MKNTKELISIIIPAYNAETTISRTLSGIVNQTYPNLEVLVVNDGSKDNTEAVVKSFITAYPDKNIILINKPNSGVSETRNMGLDKCTGKYVIFMDSDDNYIKHDALEKMHNLLIKKDVDMVVCNFTHPVFKAYLKSGKYDLTKDKDLKKYYDDFFAFGMPWNKLMKKELISAKFNKDVAFAEDELFMVEQNSKFQKVYYTSEVLINYYCAPINSENPSAINKVHSLENVKKEKAGFFFLRQQTTDIRDEVFTKHFPEKAEYFKYKRFMDFFILDILFMDRKNITTKQQSPLHKKLIADSLFMNTLKSFESEKKELISNEPKVLVPTIGQFVETVVELFRKKEDNIMKKSYKALENTFYVKRK